MGKLYLGDLEVTNYDAVMELSGITTAHTANTEIHVTANDKSTWNSHTANTEIHVTQALLDFINDLDERLKKLEPETRLVCKYNVTSTSEPTALRASYEQNIFKSMEIDGVMLDELVTEYTFDTTGVHTVKYELYDKTKLGGNDAPTFFNGNLIEAIIPDSVTTIRNHTFLACSGLTSVTIPDSVTHIGTLAFNNCYNLTSIVSNAMTAPTITSDTFKGVKTGGTLTVPSGSSGYNVWMQNANYYLGLYNWTKVEQ